MSARLPGPARAILERGPLCFLAVRTSHGPHLTPLVYALDGGRLWFSTSRSSVKARAWRRDPSAAGLVATPAGTVVFRGRARTYDTLDPLSWPRIAAAGPRLVRAATRFTLRNARFFAGYAVDAGRIPFAWTLPGRVFVGVEPEAGWLLAPGWRPVASWGEWPAGGLGLGPAPPPGESPGVPALDRGVPPAVREALGSRGEGAVALEGAEGPVVLPARWRRVPAGGYEASVPRSLLGPVGAAGEVRAALAFDRGSSWRASAMVGLLVQGRAQLFAPPATPGDRPEGAEGGSGWVLAWIRPTRVVWWEGWSSGTVEARDRRAGRRGRRGSGA